MKKLLSKPYFVTIFFVNKNEKVDILLVEWDEVL